MQHDRFRFGTSVVAGLAAPALGELARQREDEGFSLLQVPDHLGIPAPFPVLAVAAAATSSLHVGTLVANHDFWNPVLLAREAATLAVLSGGRFELGLGAGHARVEYDSAGIDYDAPATRVERLRETVGVVRRLLDGEVVTHAGTHHRLVEAATDIEVPGRVPLLVGGNGDRVLDLAATQADSVGLTGFTSGTGRVHTDLSHFRWSGLEERIGHVRDAAGDRFDDLELQVLVQGVMVGERADVTAQAAAAFEQSEELVADSPFVMLGQVDDLVEHCERLRSLGVGALTAFESRGAEHLAPVIARLG